MPAAVVAGTPHDCAAPDPLTAALGIGARVARRLHLYRNAVANRIRGITELLDVDFEDPTSGSPSSSPATRLLG